jgi:hypothetical protein
MGQTDGGNSPRQTFQQAAAAPTKPDTPLFFTPQYALTRQVLIVRVATLVHLLNSGSSRVNVSHGEKIGVLCGGVKINDPHQPTRNFTQSAKDAYL